MAYAKFLPRPRPFFPTASKLGGHKLTMFNRAPTPYPNGEYPNPETTGVVMQVPYPPIFFVSYRLALPFCVCSLCLTAFPPNAPTSRYLRAVSGGQHSQVS